MPATSPKHPELTVFVPCFNEALRVHETLTTLCDALAQVGLTYEILVTDDGSSDGTSDVVRRFQSEHPGIDVRLHRNQVNLGLAYSFIDASIRGTGEYFFQFNGDGGWAVESLVQFLEHHGKSDLVTSYFPNLRGKSWIRQRISRLYTALVNAASGNSLHYYNGVLLCKRRHIARWAPRDARFFEFNAYLITHLLAHGASLVEVPVESWHTPKNNAGNVFQFQNFVSVFQVLSAIWRRRLRFAFLAKPLPLSVLEVGLMQQASVDQACTGAAEVRLSPPSRNAA